MEFVERADDRPERISIARCRELLGEEANSMTDEYSSPPTGAALAPAPSALGTDCAVAGVMA